MVRIASAVVLLLSVYVSLATALAAAEPTDPRPLPTEGEAKVLAALAEETTSDFQAQPLSDVVATLAQQHKIAIQFDHKALSDSGVGTDTPVTVQLKKISLRSLLRLLLGELDLTYVVRDGYLLVTSKTEAENMLRVKVYPVRDLVTLDSEFAPVLPKDRRGDEDYASLINLITNTVAPTTWDEVGGPGSIEAYRRSHSITVAQTQEFHEDLVELLAVLRRAREVQIGVAKAIAQKGQAAPANDGGLHTEVYRLLPAALAPFGSGGALGMAGMGGGGMGGGAFRVAEEDASPDRPAAPAAAAPAAPAAPPAAPAADAPPKAPETGTTPPSHTGAAGWDQRLLDDWSNELARAIPRLVEPETWGAGPAAGSIQVMAGAIVVRQKHEVQDKVADFLAEILPGRIVTSASTPVAGIRLPAPGPKLDWPSEVDINAAPDHARMEALLGKKCGLDFNEEPLGNVINALAAQGPIQVWVDNRALADSGVALDVPITRSIHGVSLRSAFKLVLGELDLTYVIRDEVFRITSKTEAENMLVTKVYPVFDLVDSGPAAARPAGLRFHIVGTPPANTRQPIDFTSLIQNVTSHIGPTTWDEVGGPGAIQSFTNSAALVISQTNEVHEEIAAYLKALREAAVAQQ